MFSLEILIFYANSVDPDSVASELSTIFANVPFYWTLGIDVLKVIN